MKRPKPNYLLEAVVKIMQNQPAGKVLDLGCGDGDYSFRLKNLGFPVVALDADEERFKYKGEIQFYKHDITEKLPFADNYFDYVLMLEVIEHLKNPYFVVSQIHRILKTGGYLIISTPNILNLKSRLRFLFEGSFEFFRQPPLEQLKDKKENIFNIHICAYRLQELEFLLYDCGFVVDEIFTDVFKFSPLYFLLPLIKMQMYFKRMRSKRKGGIDYSRIHKLMLCKELLFGRHLIIKAKKFGVKI